MLVFLASFVLAAASADATGVEAAIAQGDAHYARRAEGARGGMGAPAQVEAAILQYRKAVSLDPGSYPARLRLLRAFFFRTGFCEIEQPAQVKLFDEAKKLADETVKRLQADIKEPRSLTRRLALVREPLAAEIYLWAAISWGQWAVYHKLAAVWQGAAGQVRDLSQAAIDIDPATLFGSGYLILGRLHVEAPRLAFITPWISREKGLNYLQRALEIAPESPNNRYFLADALLALRRERRAEARGLLEECVRHTPRSDYLVEDLHYAEAAAERLAGLR